MTIVERLENARWKDRSGHVTVLIPCYNRRKTIGRTLQSIEAQTYRDMEVIVVDDGSTESSDDIVHRFMEAVAFPVLYLKKENGGVHTARNAGIKEARGEFLINVDSDDELLPTALADLLQAWEQIPVSDRPQYREVVGRCVDDAGNLLGKPLQKDVNTLPWEDAYAASKATGGEKIALNVTAILKQHPFPEPEGITFIPENVLWDKLAKEYRSYFIDAVVHIVHSDGGNRLTAKTSTKTVQTIRNRRWSLWYALENEEHPALISRLRSLFAYTVMEILLRRLAPDSCKPYQLTRATDRTAKMLLRLPAFLAAFVYRKKYHIE